MYKIVYHQKRDYTYYRMPGDDDYDVGELVEKYTFLVTYGKLEFLVQYVIFPNNHEDVMIHYISSDDVREPLVLESDGNYSQIYGSVLFEVRNYLNVNKVLEE